MSRTYIFGYGSLISKESGDKTAAHIDQIPARVKGIRRGWYIHCDDPMTAVGVIADYDARCNGMLIEIDKESLPNFDAREEGYERIPIDPMNIETIEETINKEDTIWAYVLSEIEKPNDEYPVLLSYVDVIITGCMSISTDFAKEFIRTTDGWPKKLFNDRENPIYPRNIKCDTEEVDALLKSLGIIPQSI